MCGQRWRQKCFWEMFVLLKFAFEVCKWRRLMHCRLAIIWCQKLRHCFLFLFSVSEPFPVQCLDFSLTVWYSNKVAREILFISWRACLHWKLFFLRPKVILNLICVRLPALSNFFHSFLISHDIYALLPIHSPQPPPHPIHTHARLSKYKPSLFSAHLQARTFIICKPFIFFLQNECVTAKRTAGAAFVQHWCFNGSMFWWKLSTLKSPCYWFFVVLLWRWRWRSLTVLITKVAPFPWLMWEVVSSYLRFLFSCPFLQFACHSFLFYVSSG